MLITPRTLDFQGVCPRKSTVQNEKTTKVQSWNNFLAIFSITAVQHSFNIL
jgi:hypothetical protein